MIKTIYSIYDKTPELVAFVTLIREMLKVNFKKITNVATEKELIKGSKILNELLEKGVKILDHGSMIEFTLPTSEIIYAMPTATRSKVFNGFRIEA